MLLCLFFLLNLIIFSSVSTAQAPPYFINCGSTTEATINDDFERVFLRDKKSDAVRFSSHKREPAKRTSQSTLYPSEPLYQTASVFEKPFKYEFNIPTVGTYLVRLHFYAFSSSLVSAKFNVSASKHMLLPDFSPGKNATNSPMIKEFILNINQIGWFKIFFVPSSSSSSAFVNAIEVLSMPSNITEASGPLVTPAGITGEYKGHAPIVLETLYSINIGGGDIIQTSDNLWRKWVPDDQYFITKGAASNIKSSTGVLKDPDDKTPTEVYGTAKNLTALTSNLTWMFKVNKRTKHFVRVYFYNFAIRNRGPFKLNLFIYSNFKESIDVSEMETPFNKSYTVESDDHEYMNISVGPSLDKYSNVTFLNGVEILQVLEGTAAEPKIETASHIVVLIISLVASAVVLLTVLAAVIVFLLLRKRKQKASEAFEWGNLPLQDATSSHHRASESASSHGTTYQNLHLGLKIPFAEIQRVTNNFNENLIIGEGGFGKVYIGTLRSGLKVAVKRGSSDHGQGIAEFQTEIMILSTIRHRHLVSLIGYCCDNGEMILVYEFMENGTLRNHLYGSENSSTSSTHRKLSWKQRLEICLGAAKGIQYLHTGTNKGIIHRDVKSTNILLDEKYVAKVADFGLSRSGYLEQTHVSISDVKGTLGYLDPEYITCLQLTEKSDVYSFGVVLLEVLCARPVIDTSLPKERVGLVEWCVTCYEEQQLEKIVDPMIADEINPNSLKKFFETADKCLKKDAAERAPMSEVCWGLEYALQLQKTASERLPLDDSTTDASLDMPLPAVRRFPSQSISDFEYIEGFTNTGTEEVFSQLTSDDGTGR